MMRWRYFFTRRAKKRFTEAQIVGFLREADEGIAVKDFCRKHG